MAKQDRNKVLIRKAKTIANCEMNISLGKDVEFNQEKIENIMSQLNFEDLTFVMGKVDDIIDKSSWK